MIEEEVKLEDVEIEMQIDNESKVSIKDDDSIRELP